MGASGSLLMATITLLSFMPATCWMAPLMPTAMYSCGATTLPVWPTWGAKWGGRQDKIMSCYVGYNSQQDELHRLHGLHRLQLICGGRSGWGMAFAGFSNRARNSPAPFVTLAVLLKRTSTASATHNLRHFVSPCSTLTDRNSSSNHSTKSAHPPAGHLARIQHPLLRVRPLLRLQAGQPAAPGAGSPPQT